MDAFRNLHLCFLQESIAKAIEEKISGEQRRYLLNEQLKAIKKACGLCAVFYMLSSLNLVKLTYVYSYAC